MRSLFLISVLISQVAAANQLEVSCVVCQQENRPPDTTYCERDVYKAANKECSKLGRYTATPLGRRIVSMGPPFSFCAVGVARRVIYGLAYQCDELVVFPSQDDCVKACVEHGSPRGSCEFHCAVGGSW